MTVRRVAVVGPTASGKSSVALTVAARHRDVELVSIDSMQVYRSMDIGTAKPTAAERSQVRHHLIDLVDPDVDHTVADFQRAYRAVIDDLTGRDRRAILVGGTGLYHRAVIDDLDIPGEWPDLRERFRAELASDGVAALHARLVDADPVAAARIDPGNDRRIVRALEVTEGSGRRFSTFGPGLDTYPRSDVEQIGLRWDRSVLAERIERRVHDMITAGLLDEVERLVGRGMSPTARQALGYKELIEHLDGNCSLDEAVDRTIVRTRQLAVRQLRWFGRDPRVRWIDVEHDAVAEAAPSVNDALER